MSIFKRIGIWLGLIKPAPKFIIHINGAGLGDRGEWFRKMLNEFDARKKPYPELFRGTDGFSMRATALQRAWVAEQRQRNRDADRKLKQASRQFAEVVLDALQNG